jgi:hypothetical protein
MQIEHRLEAYVEKSGESEPMIQPLLIEWVQSSRWDGAIFLMIPGTSCLATIVLSLRDKTIRPSKRLALS